MRLLFAEDDRDLSAAVTALLERNGYLVDAVENGEEAVSYAEAESYDGMILDWMMPEMDGIQALCEMRKKGIRTPCMILTARDAVEDRVRGLDAGADDYLPKPFDAGELLARVRAMLRRRESYVPDVLQWEDLTLDKGSCELKCGGKSSLEPPLKSGYTGVPGIPLRRKRTTEQRNDQKAAKPVHPHCRAGADCRHGAGGRHCEHGQLDQRSE